MSFIATKFHEILSNGFRGVALPKKNRTNGRTDGKVKKIIPYKTRCMKYYQDFMLDIIFF